MQRNVTPIQTDRFNTNRDPRLHTQYNKMPFAGVLMTIQANDQLQLILLKV